MNDLSPELRRLLSALLDGELTDADKVQLNHALRDNPSAQLAYREVMSLHALLYLDFSQGFRNLTPPLIAKHAPAREAEVDDRAQLTRDVSWASLPSPRRRRWAAERVLPIALAATLAFAVAGIWWTSADVGSVENDRTDRRSFVRAQSGRGDGLGVASTNSLAVLGQATGAKWSGAASEPSVGGALSAGQFTLESGLVQLEFLSGAAVIVEGPADFELVSADRLICRRGKLRARVPAQAHGFRIDTPDYAAVDLGTEFTVDVNNSGKAEFHVLDGEVELWNLKTKSELPTETLTTGRSARVAAGGELSEVSLQQPALVGSQQLRELSEHAEQERFTQWRSFSRELRSRPDVVLYYGLDGHGEWERELRNDGPDSNELLTGAIVGCHWTSGRWTGKQALEFKRITDRVRLTVPGEFDSLTYAAWVRIEGLERWLTSLMLTDGHDENEVHWQITEEGALLLGVNDDAHNLHDYFSPKVLGPSDLGRWVHLAAVFDGNQRVVRHYLDAKQISSEQVKTPSRLRIGKAEIGNWAPNDRPGHRMRSLNGRIDEFIIFSRPLSGEQIREIYEAGKPGS